MEKDSNRILAEAKEEIFGICTAHGGITNIFDEANNVLRIAWNLINSQYAKDNAEIVFTACEEASAKLTDAYLSIQEAACKLIECELYPAEEKED